VVVAIVVCDRVSATASTRVGCIEAGGIGMVLLNTLPLR
jgi:hypothetical protein